MTSLVTAWTKGREIARSAIADGYYSAHDRDLGAAAPFHAACIDSNSVPELLVMEGTEADPIDLAEWQIGAETWAIAVGAAYEAKLAASAETQRQ